MKHFFSSRAGFALIVLFFLIIFAVFYYFLGRFYDSSVKEGFSMGVGYDNDRYPSQLVYELKPGETFEDEFILANTKKESIQLDLYVQDGAINPKDNSFFVPGPEALADNQILNHLIFPEKNIVSLSSNSRERVKLTIKIPEDAPKKEYLGMVFAHYTPNQKRLHLEGNQVAVTQRIGLKVVLAVTDNPQMPKRTKIPDPSPNPLLPVFQYLPFLFLAFALVSLSIIFFNKKKL